MTGSIKISNDLLLLVSRSNGMKSFDCSRIPVFRSVSTAVFSFLGEECCKKGVEVAGSIKFSIDLLLLLSRSEGISSFDCSTIQIFESFSVPALAVILDIFSTNLQIYKIQNKTLIKSIIWNNIPSSGDVTPVSNAISRLALESVSIDSCERSAILLGGSLTVK